MKRIALLKTLVAIAYVLCKITLAFSSFFVIMLTIKPYNLPVIIGKLSVLWVLYIGLCIFTYGMYHLKTALELFSQKIFFNERAVKSLLLTGKSFVATVVLWGTPVLFYNVFITQESDSEMGISLLKLLGLLVVGLFFIVLGDVFANAKKLKEENDLTV